MNSPRWEERKNVIEGILKGSSAFAGPEHVVIDLTNRCSNRCIACWTHSPLLGKDGPNPSWHAKEIDRKNLDNLIDDLGNLGTRIVRLTGGGDPLLYPDISGVVARIKSHGIYCAITTGLPGSTTGFLNKIIEAGVDELALSLWASDRETYVKTHPGQKAETFDRITRALNRVGRRSSPFGRILGRGRKKGTTPYVNLLNVICSLNCGKVESMYDYALSSGADSVYFTLVDTMEGSTDSLLLSGEQRDMVRAVCERIKNRNDHLTEDKRLVLDGFDGFVRRLSENSAADGHYDQIVVSQMPCYVGWIFCRIMADGRVAPCCRGVHMPMGNINDTSFKDIWYSERYDAFRHRAVAADKDQDLIHLMGCDKTCDNHVQNDDVHRMMAWVAGGSYPDPLDIIS